MKSLVFNYSMLTIQIVKYYSEVKNSTNTNIEYHYSVPTISNSSNNSWQHCPEHPREHGGHRLLQPLLQPPLRPALHRPLPPLAHVVHHEVGDGEGEGKEGGEGERVRAGPSLPRLLLTDGPGCGGEKMINTGTLWQHLVSDVEHLYTQWSGKEQRCLVPPILPVSWEVQL